jgi:hypothetical protein
MKQDAIGFLLIMSSVFSLSAFAADDISGTYVGRDSGRHYGDVTITSRGNEYLLQTCGSYGTNPPGCYPIRALIYPTGNGQFDSRVGTLSVSYGGMPCSYSIRIYVSVSGDTIYLSEYGPGQIVNKAYGTCPSASLMNYGDYIENSPYVKQK